MFLHYCDNKIAHYGTLVSKQVISRSQENGWNYTKWADRAGRKMNRDLSSFSVKINQVDGDKKISWENFNRVVAGANNLL